MKFLGSVGRKNVSYYAALGTKLGKIFLSIRNRTARKAAKWLYPILMEKVAERRPPDFLIHESHEMPYLRRWWVIPRNRFFNIYLHEILRSDDDAALHDHPWWNVSLLLKGMYCEYTPEGNTYYYVGDMVFRKPDALHRLELIGGQPVWSLFITGPRVRQWGFACEGEVGWRNFRAYHAIKREIGNGCARID